MQILGWGLRFQISVQLPGDANASIPEGTLGKKVLNHCIGRILRLVRTREKRGMGILSDACPGSEGSRKKAVEGNTQTSCSLRKLER